MVAWSIVLYPVAAAGQTVAVWEASGRWRVTRPTRPLMSCRWPHQYPRGEGAKDTGSRSYRHRPRRERRRRRWPTIVGVNKERRFPTDAELDAWLAANTRRASRLPIATRDQLEAANQDTDALKEGIKGRYIAMGYLAGEVTEPWDSPAMRVAARMLWVAERAGIEPLCEHARAHEARPSMLNCDPPFVVCMDCLPEQFARIQAKPFQWGNVCDACGRQTPTVHSATTNVGHYLVSGHVCPECMKASGDAVGST
jgi:hypothetical protein